MLSHCNTMTFILLNRQQQLQGGITLCQSQITRVIQNRHITTSCVSRGLDICAYVPMWKETSVQRAESRDLCSESRSLKKSEYHQTGPMWFGCQSKLQRICPWLVSEGLYRKAMLFWFFFLCFPCSLFESHGIFIKDISPHSSQPPFLWNSFQAVFLCL